MTANHHDDEKLEIYLRQFRAQSPKPLPGRVKFVIYRRPAAAVSVIAAVLMGVALLTMWQQKKTIPPGPQIVRQITPVANEVSSVRLGRIALEDPEKLDSYLNRLSKKLLPDTRSSHGVLKQLAKE
jgi:hypothetical protein